MINQEKIHQKLALLDNLQADCTHCGLCSEACITFQSTGWEQEAPRGRIRLAKEFMNGNIPLESAVLDTFDRCLGCHGCDSLCPYKVQYGRLREVVQELRSELAVKNDFSVDQNKCQNWVKLAWRLGSIFWRSYGWRFIRPLEFQQIPNQKSYLFTKGKKQRDSSSITLVVGCLQDVLQHEVIDSAISLLKKLGFNPYLSRSQPCCGAIFERILNVTGKQYQKRRLNSFIEWMKMPICFLSEGCACFVKRQIQGSQTYVFDIYNLLLNTLKEKQIQLTLQHPMSVYLQPYCGGSKESSLDPVKTLLDSIQGLSVHYLAYPLACCGGYGCEALWHSQYSKELLESKICGLTEQDNIVVASMDCYIQFSLNSSVRLNIWHPLQFLNQCQLHKVNI